MHKTPRSSYFHARACVCVRVCVSSPHSPALRCYLYIALVNTLPRYGFFRRAGKARAQPVRYTESVQQRSDTRARASAKTPVKLTARTEIREPVNPDRSAVPVFSSLTAGK